MKYSRDLSHQKEKTESKLTARSLLDRPLGVSSRLSYKIMAAKIFDDDTMHPAPNKRT